MCARRWNYMWLVFIGIHSLEKNAAERVRESCEFGLKSSQIFGLSARFFTDGL